MPDPIEQIYRIRIDDDDVEPAALRTEEALDEAIQRPRILGLDERGSVRTAQRLSRRIGQVFGRGLQQEIESVEPEIQAKVEADVTPAEADIDRLRDLVQQVAGAAEEITFDADGRPVATVVDNIEQQLKAIAQATVVISGDDEDAAQALQETIGLAQLAERLQPTIDIAVNDSAINAARGRIDDLAQPPPPVPVEVDTSGINTDAIGGAFRSIDTESIGSGVGGKVGDAIIGRLSAAGPYGAAIGAAGLAIGGLLSAAISESLNFDNVNRVLSAGLLLDENEAAQAASITANVYAEGLGEGLIDNADVVKQAISTLGLDAGDQAIEDASASALAISEATGQDIERIFLAVDNLLRGQVVGSAEEAFDLIARGSAELGPASEDFLDTLREYSVTFGALGIDGPEAFALIDAGIQAGARNTDSLADAIKEFQIRASEAPQAVRDSYDELGLSVGEVQALIDDQRGEEAFARVAAAVGELNNVTDQQRLLTEVIGPQWEQTGVAAIIAMGDAEFAIDQTTGSAAQLQDTLQGGVSESFDRLQRRIQLGFADTGDDVLGFLRTIDFEPLLTAAEPIIEDLSSLFTGDLLPAIQDLTVFLFEDFGPGFVDQLVPFIESATIAIQILLDGINRTITITQNAIDVVDGLLGGDRGEARGLEQRLDQVIERVEAAGEEANRAEIAYALWLEATEAGLTDIPWDDFVESAGLADEVTRNLQENAGLADEKFRAAGESIAEFNEESEDAVDPVESLDLSIQELQATVDDLFNFGADQTFANLIEQTETWAESLGDLSGVAVGVGGSIDLTSEAGRRLFDEVQDGSGVIQDLVQNLIDGDITAAQFAERQAVLTDSFRESARAAGLSSDEVDELVERFLSVPPEVGTAISASLELDYDPEGLINEVNRSIPPAEIQVRLERDSADRQFRDLTRDREATVTVRTVNVNAGNNFMYDGGLISRSGIPQLARGAIMDGIAMPSRGGTLGMVNGAMVNIAENGGQELFLNEFSSFSRQMDLIERFANGRLDRQLAEHYQGGGVGDVALNVYPQAPIADPVLMTREVGRQVVAALTSRDRRATPASWGPR